MHEIERSNRIKSVLLVSFMGLLLLAAGMGIGLSLQFHLWPRLAGFERGAPDDWIVYFVCVSITLSVWAVFTLWDFLKGDENLLRSAGAIRCSRAMNLSLKNITEEMAIAAGLPLTPEVYIVDDPAINAFSVGRDIIKAAVVVTSGLLANMNRDQLQGVVAHEIAHIKNRDVLITVMTSNITHVLTKVTLDVVRKTDNPRIIVADVVLLWPLWIILGLAMLARKALLRNREYFADASAALFTRYPEGLASALEKLALAETRLRSARRDMAFMYAADPFKKYLFQEQPLLLDRIRILRSMGGNISLDAYRKAYNQWHTGKASFPAAPISGTIEFPARRATGEGEASADSLSRARAISGILWAAQNYRTIECRCGMKIHVPPDFPRAEITCPRCGHVYPVK